MMEDDGGRDRLDDLLGERAWLVHLCLRLTGDHEVAEDLAQDTLLDAWRHGQERPVPEARRAWLARHRAPSVPAHGLRGWHDGTCHAQPCPAQPRRTLRGCPPAPGHLTSSIASEARRA